MKLSLLTIVLLLGTTAAFAQKVTVSGSVIDANTNETLPNTSVVLLNTDSVMVTGVSSDMDGNFKLPSVKAGQYILKVSFVGYQTIFKNLTLTKSDKNHNVGTLIMKDNARLLKEAEVTAQLAKVEVVADTFMYNSDAYKLPEGSMLEDLVRQLPGAVVNEDGSITINGKTISKILVKGKEFFGNDKDMALKNISTKMINKIKAYDKKSDYSRITGIDDGEEETVLDLTVKRGMGEGWMLNVDVAGGSARKDQLPVNIYDSNWPDMLYSGNVNLSRFTDQLQFMVIGSRNNTNNGSGRWGGFGGGSGVTTTTMAGLNVTWTNGKTREDAGYFEMGGNVRYNSREAEGLSVSNSETFLSSTSSSFRNSSNWSDNKSWNLNADMRLEWKLDSLTTMIARPSYSHSQNNNEGGSTSVTFNDDPYKVTDNPLLDYTKDDLFNIDGNETRTNSNVSNSRNKGNSDNGSLNIQLNRRLQTPGRNISLDVNGNINQSDNRNLNISRIMYYQDQRTQNQDRYTLSPSKSWSIQSRASYTEPLTRNLNLQLSYQYQRRFSDNDRDMYNMDELIGQKLMRQGIGGDQDEVEVDENMVQSMLYGLFASGNANENELNNLLVSNGIDWQSFTRDANNSQYATYKENNHNAQVTFRYTKKFENEQELRFNAGMSFQPQHTLMNYQKGKVDTTVTRTTYNWAPRINLRWKISKVSQFRVNYNPRMSQPSMTQLMEVTDDSNPLNINTGNAGLRSSWNNNMFAEYNGYRDSSQTSWAIRAGWGNTKNAITSATVYDSNTGASYVRPMNIDGNWNMWSNITINSALDEKKYWNLSNNVWLNYNYRLGYLSSKENGVVLDPNLIRDADGHINMNYIFSQVDWDKFKSNTKTLGVGDYLRLNYRRSFGDDWSIDFGVNGSFNYNRTISSANTNNNINSWTFNYGGSANIMFPWSVTFNTTITQQSRRGYQDKSMNTNELLWNATLQKSFLKGKAATISVEWNDILHQRSNVSRAISEFSRTDNYSNNINSYFMVHFIYRLNLMGNKEARSAGGGGFGGPGGPGGFGGGGFGGGRPGGRF